MTAIGAAEPHTATRRHIHTYMQRPPHTYAYVRTYVHTCAHPNTHTCAMGTLSNISQKLNNTEDKNGWLRKLQKTCVLAICDTPPGQSCKSAHFLCNYSCNIALKLYGARILCLTKPEMGKVVCCIKEVTLLVTQRHMQNRTLGEGQ